MRIIGGKYKGRQLAAVISIRPTQNKVRKALFDILGDIEGLSFLELCAGSGAVGFEALSRGARELVLVESGRQSLFAIKKNMESLKLESCYIYPKQAEEAITALRKDKRIFDIIFLDPPYYDGLAKKILQMLGAYDILAPNGFVAIQHFKKDELPEKAGGLELVKESRYGDTMLSLYKKEES